MGRVRKAVQTQGEGPAARAGLEARELDVCGYHRPFLHGVRVGAHQTGPPRSTSRAGVPVSDDGTARGGGSTSGGRTLRVTFFGVRGSCPCSGAGYLRYGGNTSCAVVTVGDERPIVLDLGTGLRPLGHELESLHGTGTPIEMAALLTHLHWDHIIGLPFC